MVYTIGHSNLTINQFIELLKNHSIETVYDIRSTPYSRFPQFNKENLSQTLINHHIAYILGGENLGGRIKDPQCFKTKTVPEIKLNIAELIDYQELIRRDWFHKGITDLIEVSNSTKTVIMCSEENPARCHRSLLIARRLIELEITVYHIRSDGRLEPAIIENHQPPIQQKLFDE